MLDGELTLVMDARETTVSRGQSLGFRFGVEGGTCWKTDRICWLHLWLWSDPGKMKWSHFPTTTLYWVTKLQDRFGSTGVEFPIGES
jgi:hypothetical protein